jgi:hypothetical protein
MIQNKGPILTIFFHFKLSQNIQKAMLLLLLILIITIFFIKWYRHDVVKKKERGKMVPEKHIRWWEVSNYHQPMANL